MTCQKCRVIDSFGLLRSQWDSSKFCRRRPRISSAISPTGGKFGRRRKEGRGRISFTGPKEKEGERGDIREIQSGKSRSDHHSCREGFKEWPARIYGTALNPNERFSLFLSFSDKSSHDCFQSGMYSRKGYRFVRFGQLALEKKTPRKSLIISEFKEN